jgi:preprotein translocase subunit SecE
MATTEKDKKRATDEEEESSAEEEEREDDDEEKEEDESSSDDDADAAAADGKGDSRALAKVSDEEQSAELDAKVEEEQEVQAAASLGTARYVLAGFFAAGMLGTYVLAKALHGLWATVANKDWFHRTLPKLAGVPDESMTTYSFIVAGVVGLLFVVRTYRKPEVRTWSDEVATELTKVKWPTKKEVSNSTIIVIVASTLATVYLALLDRLWMFITGKVYGGE